MAADDQHLALLPSLFAFCFFTTCNQPYFICIPVCDKMYKR